MNIDQAKAYFDSVLAQYLSLLGMPGVNVTFALKNVLLPLLERWNNGERSDALRDEMLGCK